MKKLLMMLAAVVAGGVFAGTVADKIAKDYKILGIDQWYGFERTKFNFNGRTAWVVAPKVAPIQETKCEGLAWTWTAQWAEAFVDRTGVPDLLARGFHHVTLEAFDTRGNDTFVSEAAALQAYLVKTFGFAPKVNLIGMSWGGFFSTRYAAAHPQNVARIYYDAPLMNLEGRGDCNIEPWPTDLKASDPRFPINLAGKVAAAKIPVLMVYGTADLTVPPKTNCELFIERFKAAGGQIEIIKRNLWGHHPHGLDPNKLDPILKFMTK